jgi:hypothetical protein
MKNADDGDIGEQLLADWYQRRTSIGRDNCDGWLCVTDNAGSGDLQIRRDIK